MAASLYHVIMAGGSGTRFWPASRRSLPKQFLRLAGKETMIGQTFARCSTCGPVDRIYVSAGADHREAVLAALPDLPPARFIGEPFARNTAPAVGLAALRISMIDPEAIAVFCPADHVYADPGAYAASIALAARAAASGDLLVTLGIRAARPETGYGYMEAWEATSIPGVLRAARFIEKPDPERARALVASGRHYWNASVFIWKVSSLLRAIGEHHPPLAEGLERIRAVAGLTDATAGFDAPRVSSVVESVFSTQASISIDYAVMEKAANVVVVPCNAGWSDVGSWDAIAEIDPADRDGNALIGDVVAVESRGSLVRSGGRLIALVGVNDLIVVDTGDAVLICRRGESQKVREVIAALGSAGRDELL